VCGGEGGNARGGLAAQGALPVRRGFPISFFKLALLGLAVAAAANARSQELAAVRLRPSPFDTRTTNFLQLPATIGSEITIDASQTGAPINPHIYGQYIEHLDWGISDGIWAEMLEDRKFYFPVSASAANLDQATGQAAAPAVSPWKIIGSMGTVQMVEKDAFVGRHSPHITAPGGGRPAGIYQEELGLLKGRSYTGYIVLAADGDVKPVTVSLSWGAGGANQSAHTNLPAGPNYTKALFHFTAGADSENGRLAITTSGKGTLKIGCVSLMPGDNVEGFRKDTLGLLQQLGGTVYRWPGGNFVGGYDWRDGVGERDKRPPRANPAWAGIEPNDAGLAEFARLCELLQAEPMITVNTGFGDAYSAAAEVEYANGSTNTPMGKLRAQNGHPKPFAIPWWCVGNEMAGSLDLGIMPASQYALKHNWVVEKMRQADPGVQIIASGHLGDWSQAMLANCADEMNLISEHFYVNQVLPDLAAHAQQIPDGIQRIADAHRQYRREIPALQGKDIGLALDEWNYYSPPLSGDWGVPYFFQDAFGIAAGLHEFFRNSDLIRMANYAQTAGVIGCVKTTKTHAEFDATAFPLLLYRAHFGDLPIPLENPAAPVDICAALTSDKKALTVSVINPTADTFSFKMNLKAARMTGLGRTWMITGAAPLAFNQPGEKRQVDLRESPQANLSGTVTVPACSITLFRIPVALN
jgi:alpha-N-arabinofuranosidase